MPGASRPPSPAPPRSPPRSAGAPSGTAGRASWPGSWPGRRAPAWPAARSRPAAAHAVRRWRPAARPRRRRGPRRARPPGVPAFGSGRSDRVGRRWARALLFAGRVAAAIVPAGARPGAETDLRPTVLVLRCPPAPASPMSRGALAWRAGGLPMDVCGTDQYHRPSARSYDADALISAQYLWGATGAVRGPQAPRYRGRSPQALPGGDLDRRLHRGKRRPLDVSGILDRAEHAHQAELHALLGRALILSLALQYGSFAAPATTLAGDKTEINICHGTAQPEQPLFPRIPAINSSGAFAWSIVGGPQ